jgi:uncharacterized protein involved in type VI secretion and phage assembly
MAIEQGGTGGSPNFVWDYHSKFRVEFPKAPNFELILVGAELTQSMDEHDRLSLHFKGTPFKPETSLIAGDPVIFTYWSGKLQSKFYGHIGSVDPTSSIQGGNLTINCVSASYLLKDTDQKIYKKVTADQVVAKIAKKHGMSAVTQRHPRVRAMVVQAGQSDWQICRRLAKQCGFALRADNTTITFVSKDKIFQTNRKSAPYFKYVDNSIGGVITRADRLSGTILAFSAQISDEAPELGTRINRVVTGYNHDTGTAIETLHPASAPDNTKGVVTPNEDYFL